MSATENLIVDCMASNPGSKDFTSYQHVIQLLSECFDHKDGDGDGDGDGNDDGDDWYNQNDDGDDWFNHNAGGDDWFNQNDYGDNGGGVHTALIARL